MTSVNFLPAEYQLLQKQRRFRKQFKRILNYLTIIAIIIASAEGVYYGLTFFYADKTVPVEIQKQYTDALSKKEQMNQSLEIMQKAEKDNYYILEKAEKLTNLKPASITFTKLEINESGSVLLEGYSPDPSIYNQYVNQINQENTMFSKAVVERINAGPGGILNVKTFGIKAQGLH